MNGELKQINEKFYEEVYSWRSDPFAVKYNPFAPFSFEEFCSNMRSYSANFDELYNGNDLKWAIIENDIPLAIVGLSSINKMMRTAEVGYQVNPKKRRQGIGTKAVYSLVSKTFEQTNIRKLIAMISSKNIPSCKIVEKIGFQEEGLLRKHYLINNREEDEKIYGILRDDLLKE